MISKTNSIAFMRVMIALEQQIQRAYNESRYADGDAIARLTGGLRVRFFDCYTGGDLEVL